MDALVPPRARQRDVQFRSSIGTPWQARHGLDSSDASSILLRGAARHDRGGRGGACQSNRTWVGKLIQ